MPEFENIDNEDFQSASFLEEDRVIFLVGRIDERMLASFAPILMQLDNSKGPIHIFMSSSGGDIDSGLGIYGLIRQTSNFITITGYGQILSMASIILQGADERILEENCRFMIHDGVIESPETEIGIHLARAKEAKFVNEWIQGILSKRSGLSKRQVKKLSQKETYLSAEEAVKMGFADLVLKSRERLHRD